MRPMAQMSMVMNLDKCIGCHTCSVTCKQTWTNRTGVEYVWFNNVETRPGQGYPRTYEDQDRWQGGWTLTKRGRLTLKAGGRLKNLLTIFSSPKLPSIDEYYEPWTYDYETLTTAPAQEHIPVARPKSLISGKDMKITWSANWDDDLGGAPELASADPVLAKMSEKVKLEFEQTFMFYLPRICEHCLNPSCAASCPSGAIYKRSEDGIVLVDQDRCRGWRKCITGCPYKKIYFNHRTGKAEKCTFCFPRSESFYQFMAVSIGAIAGFCTLVGMAILIYRRRTVGPVFSATTRLDKVMYLTLAVVILLGLSNTVLANIVNHYDYREGTSVWFRGIFYFDLHPELMAAAPLSFQAHSLTAFLLFALWPFTRLVHAFSAPIGYLWRPYVIYRSRDDRLGTRARRPGWERVGEKRRR